MVTECVFRTTQNKDVLKKVREDIAIQAPKTDLSQMTMAEWRETMTYEKMSNMRYLTMVLYETMRVCAPVK